MHGAQGKLGRVVWMLMRTNRVIMQSRFYCRRSYRMVWFYCMRSYRMVWFYCMRS